LRKKEKKFLLFDNIKKFSLKKKKSQKIVEKE